MDITKESSFDEVLEGVRKDGWVLEYVSEAFKNNKAIVMAAVTDTGDALA